MEYRRGLFRWKPGTPEWYDTGLIDEGEATYAFSEFSDVTGAGFKMAVSGSTVYVGKRSGHLFQSFDEGDTWQDITANLPFSVASYHVISFAGSAVYIATDKGVAYSSDGMHWDAAVDPKGTRLVIEKLTGVDTSVYGATEQQVYQLKAGTRQMATGYSGSSSCCYCAYC